MGSSPPLPSLKRLPSARLLEAGLRAGRHRAGLPGNVSTIIGSAFLPTPAYRQEGGASSRLAREPTRLTRVLKASLPAAGRLGGSLDFATLQLGITSLGAPRAQRGASRQ